VPRRCATRAAPTPAVEVPSGEAAYWRLRRMSNCELEGEIARLAAEAGCGRVVVYLSAEDPETRCGGGPRGE